MVDISAIAQPPPAFLTRADGGPRAQRDGLEAAQEFNDKPVAEKAVVVPDNPLDAAAKVLGDVVKEVIPSNTRLRIDHDDEANSFVYKAVDPKTGEVLNQFPPEQILKVVAFFRKTQGIVVDNKV
jgi:uncharacterized FlaG/YvyC family protein